MKLRRFEGRIFGLGMLVPPPKGGGNDGRLSGEDFGDPVDAAASDAAAAATGASSEMLFTVGGDALRAGLGALELLSGLATPEAKPDVGAAPLMDALALTRPLIPIPCSRRDIVGGEVPPADVPDVEPSDPMPPRPVVVGGGNVALSGDVWGFRDKGDWTVEPEKDCERGCTVCIGAGLKIVMLAPVSSAIVSADTAESKTLGTVISIASVVLDRGIR